MNPHDDYTADILANPDDDHLTTVNVLAMPTEQLEALRVEAGQHGDRDLVGVIDRILRARSVLLGSQDSNKEA